MRNLFAVAALLVSASNAAASQRLGPPADRPHLQAGLDTNNAQFYFDLGLQEFESDPDKAAAAFYWAARINPARGDALYARRAALLMREPFTLRNVMEGNRKTLESPEVRRLDSLQFRALMLSPFLFRKLDRGMFTTYIRNVSMERIRMRGGGEPTRGDMDMAIENYLRASGDAMRAWLAYSDADFNTALSFYARALSSSRDKSSIRLDRASIFAMRNEVDSAVAELKLALEEMRKKDQKDLVVFYNSKALTEYSIAVLQEGNGDMAAAREAYGRALQEDLSYYPAHMRLGLLALGTRDTATAVSELALAAELAPDEPYIRYSNAYALATANRYSESATELQKAIALEPYYALPYLLLGKVSERINRAEQSLAGYERFLALSTVDDPQREFAKTRIAYLKEYLKGGM